MSDLPSDGVPGGSGVFSSSFFTVCCVLGVLSISSESERVMQGLETGSEAEGEGDAEGLRAAGGDEV